MQLKRETVGRSDPVMCEAMAHARTGQRHVVHCLLALPALLLGLAVVPHANAIGITPNPIPITGGIRGEAHLVSAVPGVPAGAVLLEGSVAASDISLVFRVELSSDSLTLSQLGAFAADSSTSLLVQPSGAGTLSGPGVGIVGARRLVSPGVGESIDFILEGGALNPGESTDLFFISYPALLPGSIAGVVVGVADAPRRDAFSGTIVPEPSLALFMAVGLVVVSL